MTATRRGLLLYTYSDTQTHSPVILLCMLIENYLATRNCNLKTCLEFLHLCCLRFVMLVRLDVLLSDRVCPVNCAVWVHSFFNIICVNDVFEFWYGNRITKQKRFSCFFKKRIFSKIRWNLLFYSMNIL